MDRGRQTRELLRSWLTPRARTVVLGALAALLVSAATSLFWRASVNADRQFLRDSFGHAIAEQLATLSAEPMIGGDRMSLSVLAARMSEPAEVAAVSIYTIDDQVVVVSGDAPNDAPHFTHAIVFEDTVAGYARVSLDPELFGTGPGSRSVALSLFASVLFGVLAGYLVSGPPLRLGWRGPRPGSVAGQGAATERNDAQGLPDDSEPTDPELPDHFVLVVNLFNQISFSTADRNRIIDLCLARADQVTSLYGGSARELPGTGLLLAFEGSPDPDRCFQVVCASLLIAETLAALNQRHYVRERGELLFRFGLHREPGQVPAEALPSSDAVRDAVVLSAVASNGTVAASTEVFTRIADPDRLHAALQNHAVLASLNTASVGRCAIITALKDSYRMLIDSQAARLIDQDDSTSSPSTF